MGAGRGWGSGNEAGPRLVLRPGPHQRCNAWRPTAVVDAKYKAEKPAGFPNADVYQMLAYCTRLGLPMGWLVYAKGNEAGATHEVVGAGIEVRARVLDLALPPSDLVAQVDALAAQIVAGVR